MKTNDPCVLFIDDDKATNFFNTRIARNHGYFKNIVTLQSGSEALKYLRSSANHDERTPKPDLIFLDINMPAMNGWEFLEQFYQLGAAFTQNISIVILSTSTEPVDLKRYAMDQRLIGFVHKPLKSKSLTKIVHEKFIYSNPV